MNNRLQIIAHIAAAIAEAAHLRCLGNLELARLREKDAWWLEAYLQRLDRDGAATSEGRAAPLTLVGRWGRVGGS